MRTGKTYIFLIAAALVLFSCEKQGPEAAGSRLDFKAAIEPSAQTKAVYDSTDFKKGETFGLFIYRHDTYTAYHNASDIDIKAMKDNTYTDGWKYAFGASSNYTPVLYLGASDTSADIYAYAPWMTTTVSSTYSYISSITGINYMVYGTNNSHYPDDQLDLMWAIQNAFSTNKNITADNEDKTVTLNFRHALSRIYINVKLAQAPVNGNTPVTLTRIDIQGKDAQSKLYGKGVFNAATGEFTDYTRASSLYFVPQKDITLSASEYKGMSFLLIPAELEDDEFEIALWFNSVRCRVTYKIKASDVLHSDDETKGLQPGYKYTFNFLLDNYIHFAGVTIEDGWVDGDSHTYTY